MLRNSCTDYSHVLVFKLLLTQIYLFLQILTKDSVTVFVNAIMYFKVKNAIHAVANVDDYGGSARLLAATTLRNVLGTMTLGEILSQRENIAKEMKVFTSACLYTIALNVFVAGNARCCDGPLGRHSRAGGGEGRSGTGAVDARHGGRGGGGARSTG